MRARRVFARTDDDQDPGIVSSGEQGPSDGNQHAKADEALRRMSEYMNTLEQFSFHSENSVGTLLTSGQKIQLGRLVDISVRRPNRLRADIKGDIFDQQFYYDGKDITLYGKRVNYYATTKAPETIESALSHAEQSFGLVAPAAEGIS